MLIRNLTITLPFSSFLMNVGHSMMQPEVGTDCGPSLPLCDAASSYGESQYGGGSEANFLDDESAEENFLDEKMLDKKISFRKELDYLAKHDGLFIKLMADLAEEDRVERERLKHQGKTLAGNCPLPEKPSGCTKGPRRDRLQSTVAHMRDESAHKTMKNAGGTLEWLSENLEIVLKKNDKACSSIMFKGWQERNLTFCEKLNGCQVIRWNELHKRKHDNYMFVHLIRNIRTEGKKDKKFSITVPDRHGKTTGKQSLRTFTFKCSDGVSAKKAVAHLKEFVRTAKFWVRNSQTGTTHTVVDGKVSTAVTEMHNKAEIERIKQAPWVAERGLDGVIRNIS